MREFPMLSRIRQNIAALRKDKGGNAALMVAVGLPALIGGSGLAVDVSQWYMWKRELQYAVDQGALAGAWARANSNSAVRDTYQTRARQEYSANLSLVDDFDTAEGPSVNLTYFGPGVGANNAVIVASSATRQLPFSSLLTGDATTVAASATATYQGGVNFTACMLALNPSAYQAFKLGNSVTGSSTCGVGALSDDDNAAMKETGDTDIPLGTIVSMGSVDDTFSNNGTIYEHQSGLSDPYEDITQPDPTGQPARSYPGSCPTAQPASTTYAADGSTRSHYTFKYYKGPGSNNWTLQPNYNGTGYIAESWSSPVSFTSKAVTASATVGLQAETPPAEGTPVKVTGNGNNAYWRLPFTSTQDTITNIATTTIPASDGKVYLSPGTYTSISVACPTVFSPGIYFISGDLDFGQNQPVTATGGVMFVMLGNSSAIRVNSNSTVTLSGIEAATLSGTYGYSAEEAAKLSGMLFWDTHSSADFSLNGNSELHLSGAMYMPHREATFNGNSTADGNCMMIAADKIKIEGNFSITNFCVTTGGSAMSIGGTVGTVKLVA